MENLARSLAATALILLSAVAASAREALRIDDNGAMYYGSTRTSGWWYWDLGGKDIKSHWAFLIPIDKMADPKVHSYYLQLHSKNEGEIVDEEKHRVNASSLDAWTAEYKGAKPLQCIQVDPFEKSE